MTIESPHTPGNDHSGPCRCPGHSPADDTLLAAALDSYAQFTGATNWQAYVDVTPHHVVDAARASTAAAIAPLQQEIAHLNRQISTTKEHYQRRCDTLTAARDRLKAQLDGLGACTCTTSCPEDPTENGCAHCRQLDATEPCPVVGFGCGATSHIPCQCCTLDQRLAARGATR